MEFKIYGNRTRNGDAASLCNSCRYSSQVKGQRESDDVTLCHAFDRLVRMKVVECNRYFNSSVPDYDDFRHNAYLLIDGKFYSQAEMMNPFTFQTQVTKTEDKKE